MEELEIYNEAKSQGIPIVKNESHEILKQLISKNSPSNILEIGTAVGYSGIAILNSCSGKLITIEHNKSFIKKAKENFRKHKLSKRVKIINGDCLVELTKMVFCDKWKGYFDFIFLDGPKAQYSTMLDGLVYLLKSDGIILVDNVLFRGYTNNQTLPPTKRYKTIIKRLNEFKEKCKNHPNLSNFKLIDVEDGLIYAKKVNDEK